MGWGSEGGTALLLLFALTSLITTVEGTCVSGSQIDVLVVPDANPEELFWEVLAFGGVGVVGNGSDSSTVCIPNGWFGLYIYDLGADGLCCSQGLGSINFLSNGESVFNASDFGLKDLFIAYMFDGSVFPDDPNTPTAPPTTPPLLISCSAGEQLLQIKILHDYFPKETEWELKKLSGSNFNLLSTGNTSTEICLTPNQYAFAITDSGNNGICCTNGHGHYSLVLGGETISFGGEFETSDVSFFTVRNPLTTSCQTGERLVSVAISPDSLPTRSSFSIFEYRSVIPVFSGTATASACLPAGDYVFGIFDTSADGFTSSGNYSVSVDGATIVSGSPFGASDFHVFSISTQSPSVSPSVSPSQSPTIAPTNFVFPGVTSCPGDQTGLNIYILNDNKPEETSYVLERFFSNSQTTLHTTGVSNTTICLDPGFYILSIVDLGEDGVCCSNGTGEIRFGFDGVQWDMLSNFGMFESYLFEIKSSIVTAPTPAPAFQCGCDEYPVTVVFDVSVNPWDLTWSIKRLDAVDALLSGTQQGGQGCLPRGTYMWYVEDSGITGIGGGDISLYVGSAVLDTVPSNFSIYHNYVFRVPEDLPTTPPPPAPTPGQFVGCDDCTSYCAAFFADQVSCTQTSCTCGPPGSGLDGNDNCRTALLSAMSSKYGISGNPITSSTGSQAWSSSMALLRLDDYVSCLGMPGPEAQCLYFKFQADSGCDRLDIFDRCDIALNLDISGIRKQYYWPFCFPSQCLLSLSSLYGSSGSPTLNETCNLS